MDTQPETWGRCGENATDKQKIGYSSQKEKASLDLFFIDGRFRVACCLKCYNIINNNCVIAFDDFITREHYFDIVEKTEDNRMVILKKKNNKVIPHELIKKYELIQE